MEESTVHSDLSGNDDEFIDAVILILVYGGGAVLDIFPQFPDI